MKVLKINTCLSPAEALVMIELCDALREQLAKNYGEEIREMMYEANCEKEEDLQRWLELEDPF